MPILYYRFLFLFDVREIASVDSQYQSNLEPFIAKNRNTFEKMKREAERKEKREAKRLKKQIRKETALLEQQDKTSNTDSISELPDLTQE